MSCVALAGELKNDNAISLNGLEEEKRKRNEQQLIIILPNCLLTREIPFLAQTLSFWPENEHLLVCEIPCLVRKIPFLAWVFHRIFNKCSYWFWLFRSDWCIINILRIIYYTQTHTRVFSILVIYVLRDWFHMIRMRHLHMPWLFFLVSSVLLHIPSPTPSFSPSEKKGHNVDNNSLPIQFVHSVHMPNTDNMNWWHSTQHTRNHIICLEIWLPWHLVNCLGNRMSRSRIVFKQWGRNSISMLMVYRDANNIKHGHLLTIAKDPKCSALNELFSAHMGYENGSLSTKEYKWHNKLSTFIVCHIFNLATLYDKW